MPFLNLHDVYADRVAELRDIETELTQALPVFADAASSEALTGALAEHLEDTRRQLERLDTVIAEAGDVTPRLSQPVRAMITEATAIATDRSDPTARDVALIAAVQQLEHHEIAVYGTAHALASELGLEQSADLLRLTLSEEIASDERLTSLAQGGLFSDGLNQRADR